MPGSGSGPDVQIHKVNVAVLRFIVFMLITTFIVVGPIYRQAFGGTNKIFKNWIMFSHIGTGIVDARFSLVLDNGSEVLLDRYEVLGLSRNKNNNNPRNSRVIRERHGGAQQVAERLCEEMDEGSVIRIHARVATVRGWKVTHDNSALNCDSMTLESTN